jgi:hypothetical protein
MNLIFDINLNNQDLKSNRKMYNMYTRQCDEKMGVFAQISCK